MDKKRHHPGCWARSELTGKGLWLCFYCSKKCLNESIIQVGGYSFHLGNLFTFQWEEGKQTPGLR